MLNNFFCLMFDLANVENCSFQSHHLDKYCNIVIFQKTLNEYMLTIHYSQEGILWPWKGYSSIALFHYNVPDGATRATWEFASFQDSPDCPSRQVHVWIQHGSYPVINASSTVEFPTSDYYGERSYMEWLTLESAYKPSDTLVHPVYNPKPGSWFVAAYLEPANVPSGFLRQKCRYSLGSIALW